jgi:hypothetical protein
MKKPRKNRYGHYICEGRCPKCGSSHVSDRGSDEWDNGVAYYFECLDCHAEYHEFQRYEYAGTFVDSEEQG